MSTKIDIDSCDTLSDHVKKTTLIYPETQKLQFAPINNKPVMRWMQDDLCAFNGTRPIVIITSSISDCYDISALLMRVLGEDKVQTIYPHTVQTADYSKPVLVIAFAAFQVTSNLIENLIKAGSLLLIGDQIKLDQVFSSIQPLIGQLPPDCKIVPLSNIEWGKEPASEPEIIIEKVTVETVSSKEAMSKSEIPGEFIVTVEKESTEDVELKEAVTKVEVGAADDTHHIVLLDRNYKRSYLRNRLKGSDRKTLIITRTRHNAHRLEEYLYQGKVKSRILHANLSDEAKEKVIERFQSPELSVLLMPEAVALSVQLSRVDDIIFFDIPDVGIEFKNRVDSLSEHFKVNNTSSIVTNDEISWIDAMEAELQWVLPKVQATQPQRTHNILRIKDRNPKQEKTEKTERRTGRGLRKLGNKNNPKKRTNQYSQKNAKVRENDNDQPQHNVEVDPFNNVNQSIVNENRNPFAFDSFEANVSRQNKKRVKQLFSNRREAPQRNIVDDFNVAKPAKKSVKIVHRKKRTFDIDGNQ